MTRNRVSTIRQRRRGNEQTAAPSRRSTAGGKWQDVLRCPKCRAPFPPVSRRRVLISGAALALLSTTAVGCGAPAKRPDVEALVAQLDRARADSQLAAGAASAARPDVAAALTTVAAERSAHVQALSDEITRISGETPQTPASASATSTNPTSTGTTGEPLPPPNTARRHRRPQAIRGQRGAGRRAADWLPRRAARLDRRIVHGGVHRRPRRRAVVVTSPEPSPSRPPAGPDAALFDAVANEHGVIYGYGLVSAHSTPDVNDLVSDAMAEHRQLREDAIARSSAATCPPRCLRPATRCRSRSTAPPTPRSWR